MRPIDEIPAAFCRRVRGIFCDLDDTLTLHGKLLATSYNALWALQEAGLRVVVVTGRPGGWVDHIARMWPVDAVVGENGAFYFWMQDNKIHRHFVQDGATREAGRLRLEQVESRVLQEVPRAAVSADQKYRESDLAIDFCEDIPPLSSGEVYKIVETFRQAGAQVKVSSIHVNGWFGEFNKFSTCQLVMSRLWQEKPENSLGDYIYCGDSPNDEPMFAAFPVSVGVANIAPWLGQMKSHPSYQTTQPGGYGFAELVDWILRKRRASA